MNNENELTDLQIADIILMETANLKVAVSTNAYVESILKIKRILAMYKYLINNLENKGE